MLLFSSNWPLPVDILKKLCCDGGKGGGGVI